MKQRKTAKKTVQKPMPASGQGGARGMRSKRTRSDEPQRAGIEVKEPAVALARSTGSEPRALFKVTRGDKQTTYAIRAGFGYFIPSLRKAETIAQVLEVVETGISSGDIQPIIEFLDLKVPEIARATSVSPSTVSRWKEHSSIGVPGSNQFFRIDEVIRKGADLFGGLEDFKNWLHNPNMALGNAMPAKLMTTHIGVELVDEALDALHYGNVM